jgi:hypothetical protein
VHHAQAALGEIDRQQDAGDLSHMRNPIPIRGAFGGPKKFMAAELHAAARQGTGVSGVRYRTQEMCCRAQANWLGNVEFGLSLGLPNGAARAGRIAKERSHATR